MIRFFSKTYIIITLLFLAVFMVACDPMYVLADTAPETVVVTEIVTETVVVQDTSKIEELEVELQNYKDLINNLNELLGNVYEVYGKLDNGAWTGGTGFSIEYNGKYYLITAGHVIDNEYGIFKNLGFKVNGKYIYPELIDYNVDYGIDYAIFYSDKITSGFKLTDEPDYDNLYILGHLQAIKKISNGDFLNGESGSPVIDINGNAVGVINTAGGVYTLINSFIDTIK